MTDQDLIDRFAARHFPLNNISEVRARRHVRLLRQFEEWLPMPIEQTTPEHVREWMTEAVSGAWGRKYHVNTVRFWLMMLRPFFRFMWECDAIGADAYMKLRDVPPPRGATGQSTPKPYTRKEIEELWRAIERQYPLAAPGTLSRWERRRQLKRPPRWPRVAVHARRLQLEAIVSLALYCGLRRSEIYNLSLDDLHPDNAYIVVRGKRTDHQENLRPVAWNDAAREAVVEWLKFRRTLAIKKHRSPWLCLYGKRYREQPYETQFNKLLSNVGKGYEYHRLRHTCATERLRAGMPLEVLARFLGHSNIQQTLGYAKIVEKDIDVQVRKSDEEFMRAVGHRRRRAAA